MDECWLQERPANVFAVLGPVPASTQSARNVYVVIKPFIASTLPALFSKVCCCWGPGRQFGFFLEAFWKLWLASLAPILEVWEGSWGKG